MEYFRFGLKLTIGFLTVGTIILMFFYFTLSAKVAMFAYLYTGAAILMNWLYTAFLLINLLRGKISAKNTLKTVGLMALGIPVALLYSYAMVFLASYARITFKNTTGSNLTHIQVEGCHQKEIKNLDHGESKTVWIKILGDCKVEIDYVVNGVRKRETVVGYLSTAGGLIATYEVGSNRDVLEEI